MRLTTLLTLTTTLQPTLSFFLGNPTDIAVGLRNTFPNPSIALLPQPFWWWQSGSAVTSLITYTHTTQDPQFQDLLANTLLSQATGTNDFMTADATGNDDQAWWALAALTAAESNLPAPSIPWATLAHNVFQEQKSRWHPSRCNGGIKWKIREGDEGWTYKSTITNGLFFQLAARLARHTGDADARAWAEKMYDWVASVGLISPDFDVYDGTDDAKGDNGCVDVNHNQWSYNVGVFLYGAAVMADVTGEQKWADRAAGFVRAAKRSFVKDGRLFERICEGEAKCNTDQVSFKATLARWMGATALLRPELRAEVEGIVIGAANAMMGSWSPTSGVMEQFTALEVVDAAIASGEFGAPSKPVIAKRSIAGRILV